MVKKRKNRFKITKKKNRGRSVEEVLKSESKRSFFIFLIACIAIISLLIVMPKTFTGMLSSGDSKDRILNINEESMTISEGEIIIQQNYEHCDYNLTTCKTSDWISGKVYCLNESIKNSSTCMSINVDDVILDCMNFNITGNRTDNTYGINITNRKNITIKNCVVSNFSYGIYLYSSSNNTLINITSSGNLNAGFWISANSNNNILTNIISSNNSQYGISLYSISNNNVLTNIISNNNIYQGIYLYSSSNNMLTNITSSNNSYGVYLYSSSNNTLTDITSSNNSYNGLLLYSSSNNTLANITLRSNKYNGLSLDSSSNNNNLINSRIFNNSVGINITSSVNNTIYNNYFENNLNAFDDSNEGNYWNTTLDCSGGLNILEYGCIGGNYWSDYTGEDINGDGIGDTNLPYNSSNNISVGGDWLPLMYKNNPPYLVEVKANSTSPFNLIGYDLVCQANARDIDEDNITYYGFWYRNGEQYLDRLSRTLNYYEYIDGTEQSFGLAIDEQNNITVAGYIKPPSSSERAFFTKYNSTGSILWNVSIGSAYGNLRAYDVAANSLNQIIGVGYSPEVSSSYKNFWIAMFLANGSFIRSSGGGIEGRDEELYGVAIDSRDNIIVTGYRIPTSGNYDVYIAKYNSDLSSQLWYRDFNVSDMDKGYGVAIDSRDNIIVTGYTSKGDDIITIKYNSSGSLLWNKTASYSFDVGKRVAIDSQDNIIVVGYSNYPSGLIILKYNSTGDLLWDKIISNNDYSIAGNDVSVDSEDNILVVGYYYNQSSFSNDLLILKYNATGNNIWNKTFSVNIPSSGYGCGIAVDNEDNVVISGSFRNKNSLDDNILMLKYHGFEKANQLPARLVNVSVLDGIKTSAGENWSCRVKVSDGKKGKSNYVMSNNIETSDKAVLTGDMYFSGNAFVITKNNIIIDGQGYSIIGDGTGIAFDLSYRDFVTIKNIKIKGFEKGIYIKDGDSNIISSNIITQNKIGIELDTGNEDGEICERNYIFNNTIYRNFINNIRLTGSSHNIFINNKITDSVEGYGINITNGSYLVPYYYEEVSLQPINNTFYNNYIENNKNVYDEGLNNWNTTLDCFAGPNILGYDCIGGNYWSDYTGEDINGDGIGDTNLPWKGLTSIQNGGDWLPLVKLFVEERGEEKEEGCKPSWEITEDWGDCVGGYMNRTWEDKKCRSSYMKPENCVIVERGKCIQREPCGVECLKVEEKEKWGSCINGKQKKLPTKVYCGVLEVLSEPEEVPCEIKPVAVTYSPLQSTKIVPHASNLDFFVDVVDISEVAEPLSLRVNWYVNGELVKEEMGKKELKSEFSSRFNSDYKIKAEIIQEGYEDLKKVFEWNLTTIFSNCVENWKCFDYIFDPLTNYVIPINCVDFNNCGTNLYYPSPRKHYCNPKLNCSDWSECKVEYDINDVFKEKYIKEGKQKRVCNDLNFCYKKEFEEYKNCSVVVPIKAKKTRWCNETFIEIYTKADNKLVSRLREKEALNISRVELSLVEPELKGYCSYCFDGIKNYDEEEVDCGGENCPPCLSSYSDNFMLIKRVTEGLTSVLIIFFIYHLIKSKESFKEIWKALWEGETK